VLSSLLSTLVRERYLKPWSTVSNGQFDFKGKQNIESDCLHNFLSNYAIPGYVLKSIAVFEVPFGAVLKFKRSLENNSKDEAIFELSLKKDVTVLRPRFHYEIKNMAQLRENIAEEFIVSLEDSLLENSKVMNLSCRI